MDSFPVDGGASLPSIGSDGKKRRVAYFYEHTIGDYYYGQRHPMKPKRITIAHDLILSYGLHRCMQIFQPLPAKPEDIQVFHSADYVKFLSTVSPTTLHEVRYAPDLHRYNIDTDCPVFDGLFEFCQASAGGSIGAAAKLNHKEADIAINWAGGLHHAKKGRASGFCYVNDIVLGILELLKVHPRVLYIDIDVHHGDGVEEAFYTTDRVMTVSFHKYGKGELEEDYFFPGTGHFEDIGAKNGKFYALNVPLHDGIDDESFNKLFYEIITKVREVYRPDVIVLQSGADSLAGDRLGCFNLSVKGHANCLRFIRSFNIPLMVLGGGGYTIRNVARSWCYETAVAVGIEPENRLPYNDYYEFFGPDYNLHVTTTPMRNYNSASDLEKLRTLVLERLSKLPHAPSVPFEYTPCTTGVPEEEEDAMDERPRSLWNGANAELDSDGE